MFDIAFNASVILSCFQLTKPQLIEIPSFARSPVAPVRFSRSEPARSTKWNLAVNVSNSVTEDTVESASFPSSAAKLWKEDINLLVTDKEMYMTT